MVDRLTIRRPDGFHVHFRRGKMLRAVVPETARVFGRALVMPNTDPPIETGEQSDFYYQEILAVMRSMVDTWPAMAQFEPLMTIKITPTTTPEIIKRAISFGVVAGKVYPDGVTTNSENGVRDFQSLWPTFAAMEDVGMVLCLHGEMPGAEVLNREIEFLGILAEIAYAFPKLRIVLEHISTKDAVWAVRSLPDNVAATITLHHMLYTLDDLLGDKLRPDLFCKPVVKYRKDRDCVLEAALSGEPKFFHGSDSAPHAVEFKHCDECAAGVYTAPILMQMLAQAFDDAGCLDMLEDFTSRFGAQHYGLPLNQGTITLVRKPYRPPAYSGVSVRTMPLPGDGKLNWSIQKPEVA